MRKIIAFTLFAFMMLSFTSCGKETVRVEPADAGQDAPKSEQIKYEFNDYEPIRFQEVVWTAMSEKMSKEDFEEFSEYLPALMGESAVHWQADADDDAYTEEGFQGSDKTVSQVFQMLQGKIRSVSFCDMTRDGVKELILEGSHLSYPHLIIHKKGNEYYGAAYVRRQFQSPQKSGYFWWGKGNGHWYCLTFRDERFEMTAAAGIETETKENGTDQEESYYIHNKKADAKSYKRWEEKNLTGGIEKYELPSFSQQDKAVE